MHCNAPSLGFLFDGILLEPVPMFKTSSKSTKLSLGKVSPRNIRETPTACTYNNIYLII
jgi:hypothetical protein